MTLLQRNLNGYMVEQEQLRNHGKGSNPVVTRAIRHDGLVIFEVIGPHIRPSQFRITDKTSQSIDRGFGDWLHFVFNFDFGKVHGMTVPQKKAFIRKRMIEEGFKR